MRDFVREIVRDFVREIVRDASSYQRRQRTQAMTGSAAPDSCAGLGFSVQTSGSRAWWFRAEGLTSKAAAAPLFVKFRV